LCSGQGTAFTYQGRLQILGQPAAGQYDFTYSLFDTNSGGSQLGNTITNLGVSVTNGLFTAVLDFGPGSFPGAMRWLEIDVRTNGGGSFATLTPRQPLTPSPYAITAENLNGTLSSGGLAGNYGHQVSLNNPGNQFTGTYVGNGRHLQT